MTPALLALSRAYLALPGAPEPTPDRTRCDTRENDGLRDANGIRWTRDSDRSAYNLPDLTDAATGGVMLDRFARVGGFGVAFDPSVAVGRWLAGDWFDLVHEGATLAEAVARAAVALGRAS